MKQPLMPFQGPTARVPCRGLSMGDKFNSILLDVAIWRGLLALGEPFRRLLTVLLFLARSSITLAGDAKRVLWQGLGWLSAPPRTPLFRSLGYGFVGARRWHFAVGEYVLPHVQLWAATQACLARSATSVCVLMGLCSQHCHLGRCSRGHKAGEGSVRRRPYQGQGLQTKNGHCQHMGGLVRCCSGAGHSPGGQRDHFSLEAGNPAV